MIDVASSANLQIIVPTCNESNAESHVRLDVLVDPRHYYAELMDIHQSPCTCLHTYGDEQKVVV